MNIERKIILDMNNSSANETLGFYSNVSKSDTFITYFNRLIQLLIIINFMKNFIILLILLKIRMLLLHPVSFI